MLKLEYVVLGLVQDVSSKHTEGNGCSAHTASTLTLADRRIQFNNEVTEYMVQITRELRPKVLDVG